jgi:hypothetical protein
LNWLRSNRTDVVAWQWTHLIFASGPPTRGRWNAMNWLRRTARRPPVMMTHLWRRGKGSRGPLSEEERRERGDMAEISELEAGGMMDQWTKPHPFTAGPHQRAKNMEPWSGLARKPRLMTQSICVAGTSLGRREAATADLSELLRSDDQPDDDGPSGRNLIL